MSLRVLRRLHATGKVDPSPRAQKAAFARAAARSGDVFRAAEELRLTRADVDALIARRPGHYDALRYWRAVDERN